MKKHITLLLATSAMLLVAGCCTTPHQVKWEYKEVEMPSGPASEAQLNQLGDQGWSVVCATTSTRGIPLYVLKRAKQ